MKIAVAYNLPSPESNFVIKALSEEHDVCDVPEWALGQNSGVVHDYLVSVGMDVCYSVPARKKVLFLFGSPYRVVDHNWDTVIVVNKEYVEMAVRAFGHGTKVMFIEPPLLDIDIGKRRMVEKQEGFIMAAPVNTWSSNNDVRKMNLWGYASYSAQLFDSLEFNSAVRGGMIGFYPMVDHGHDYIVKKHFALGGSVYTEKNGKVFGDLNDLISPRQDKIIELSEPVNFCSVTESDYAEQVREIFR